MKMLSALPTGVLKMMKSSNSHGGKREGAGRKSSGKVGKSYYLTLSPEATEKLQSVGRCKSEYIDKLIMADIKVVYDKER